MEAKQVWARFVFEVVIDLFAVGVVERAGAKVSRIFETEKKAVLFAVVCEGSLVWGTGAWLVFVLVVVVDVVLRTEVVVETVVAVEV